MKHLVPLFAVACWGTGCVEAHWGDPDKARREEEQAENEQTHRDAEQAGLKNRVDMVPPSSMSESPQMDSDLDEQRSRGAAEEKLRQEQLRQASEEAQRKYQRELDDACTEALAAREKKKQRDAMERAEHAEGIAWVNKHCVLNRGVGVPMGTRWVDRFGREHQSPLDDETSGPIVICEWNCPKGANHEWLSWAQKDACSVRAEPGPATPPPECEEARRARNGEPSSARKRYHY